MLGDHRAVQVETDGVEAAAPDGIDDFACDALIGVFRHMRIEYRASSAQPVVLLVRPDHPLARRGTPATISDLLAWPLALMPSTFGIGHLAEMLAFAENVEIRATLTTSSLTALKRFVADEHFATLIGAFAASREIEAGELVTVPIDHALFQGTQARVLVKSGRPLVAAAHELLAWILQRMTMFGAARTGESSE
jgi:DNA-binding transcriptional LysR family regulator